MNNKEFYKKRNFETEHPDYYNKIECDYVTYLDIGCANWNGIKIVEQKNNIKKSYGIDIYKSTPKTIVKDLNIQDIPLKDIEIISAFEIIEHINNTEHFIKEIHKTLAKDGTLYLSTPNLAWWMNRILLLFGYQPANTEVDFNHSMYGKPKIFKDNMGSGHIHLFTYKAMKEFLKSNGFKILKVYPSSSNYSGILSIFSFIDKIISYIPGLARGYVYVCNKEEQ